MAGTPWHLKCPHRSCSVGLRLKWTPGFVAFWALGFAVAIGVPCGLAFGWFYNSGIVENKDTAMRLSLVIAGGGILAIGTLLEFIGGLLVINKEFLVIKQ